MSTWAELHDDGESASNYPRTKRMEVGDLNKWATLISVIAVTIVVPIAVSSWTVGQHGSSKRQQAVWNLKALGPWRRHSMQPITTIGLWSPAFGRTDCRNMSRIVACFRILVAALQMDSP